MESGPAIVQQRAVDHFTRKRMFETIFQVGKQIDFEKKFRCLQIEQITLDLLVGQAGHGLQQPQRHHHADHRRGLEQLFFRHRQSVDPFGENRAHRARHAHGVDCRPQRIGSPGTDQSSGLGQRTHDFFDEKWVSSGAFDQQLAQRCQFRLLSDQ